MDRRAAPPRLRRVHRGGRRRRGRRAPGPRFRRAGRRRPALADELLRHVRRRRCRHRGEHLLAADEPTRRTRRGRRPAGAAERCCAITTCRGNANASPTGPSRSPPTTRGPTSASTNSRRRRLRERGIDARVIYNHFDIRATGRAAHARDAIGVDGLLALQPTRAIARKNIPASIEIASETRRDVLDGRPARGGLRRQPSTRCSTDARVPSSAGLPTASPSTTPTRRATSSRSPRRGRASATRRSSRPIHRKPLVVGHYPVLRRTPRRSASSGTTSITSNSMTTAALDHNYEIAERYFNLRDLPALIEPSCWETEPRGNRRRTHPAPTRLGACSSPTPANASAIRSCSSRDGLFVRRLGRRASTTATSRSL